MLPYNIRSRKFLLHKLQSSSFKTHCKNKVFKKLIEHFSCCEAIFMHITYLVVLHAHNIYLPYLFIDQILSYSLVFYGSLIVLLPLISFEICTNCFNTEFV